ncbi:MAG: hypothetical protein ACFB16_01440 [Phormidesmis sp.]
MANLNAADLEADVTAPESLSTEALKARVLRLVSSGDDAPMSKKVKFLNERLLPLFQVLACRNPTPDLTQQIPLVQGTWRSVWSTIPFQDILPGRVHEQSYQIFADNGLYANLARYRPGHKKQWLSWISKWLLSYDLMIVQTYAVDRKATEEGELETAPSWVIENVGIRQVLRFGPTPLSVKAANDWFQSAITAYENKSDREDVAIPTARVSRSMEKKYEKVAKAKPQLEHLYIDRDFRLVKSLREKNQRPSYTIAVRIEASDKA